MGLILNDLKNACELEHVCDYVNNRTTSSMNYISTENMLPNKGGISESTIIPPGTTTEYKIGDILISNIRPYFQKIWCADRCGGCSADVLCIRAKENTDSKYLYYLLSQQAFFDYVMSGAKGCKMPRGDKKQIMQWPVNIPAIDVQKKVVAILSSLDNKIRLNRRINDNLEEQAKALFKSWFVDFEPFKGGKFVDSELGLIPKGWSTGTIYSYIDVIYGAPYKSALFNDKKQGLPLIRIRDLKTYTPQYYTKEVLPNTEYVECGDIIAGMDAEFIPHIWRGEKGVLNQRLCKFVPKYDYVSKYYIYSLVYPKLAFVQSYKVGTTVSHLGKADIDRFKVIVPPEDIIMQYSKIVNSYFAEIVKVSNENQILSSLRDTLLPKLMSGELSVEEVSLD
ncbi:restriction endonuclease subunit S [Alistipes shahii]|jgi:type I restriction enzyme S subunit|uniref:restriction endonuclease subunit S n=3 Tax=Bacteroidales TaxID=171549 RepID=UPI0020982055|nr:restriction endonuclease subunit S [Alistipes shahii]MCO7107486.1 restriction endonuclease subunit S [Alistipes shahii]